MPQTLPTLALLALAFSAMAQGPSISLPKEVKGDVGDWIVVEATTDGKQVRWVAMSSALKVFPTQLLKDSKSAVVQANRPGRYRLLAYTAVGDVPSDPVITYIVVTNGPDPEPPTPPDPKPPGPTPPVPPVPPGPPPDPVDAFTAKIRAALASDPGTAPDKAKHAAALSGFYAAMARHVDKKQVATVGDLLADYKVAMKAVLPDGVIPATRGVCGQIVFDATGEDGERKIDDDLKASLVALFGKLSKALEVKP